MEYIFIIIQSKILSLKWLRTQFIPFPLLLTAIHIIYAGVFTFDSFYFLNTLIKMYLIRQACGEQNLSLLCQVLVMMWHSRNSRREKAAFCWNGTHSCAHVESKILNFAYLSCIWIYFVELDVVKSKCCFYYVYSSTATEKEGLKSMVKKPKNGSDACSLTQVKVFQGVWIC